MTGFEPATTRPPDVYSTGLSYIPKNDGAKVGEKIEICKCFWEKCVQKFESFLGGLFFFVFGDFFALVERGFQAFCFSRPFFVPFLALSRPLGQ